jgi:hypothetical protein
MNTNSNTDCTELDNIISSKFWQNYQYHFVPSQNNNSNTK